MNPILDRYQIQHKIGKGTFGVVFQGIHLKTLKPIAIKREHEDSPVKNVKHEATVLHYLYNQGCRSIPRVYWFGLHENFYSLVMTYYPVSLYDYRKTQPISEKEILGIMIQMIDVLQEIHRQNIIHRDIKPPHFMMGENRQIHLIDFGLASVETARTSELIIGTPKYISYPIHCGMEPLKRDDLISVGYVALFLFLGYLPWEQEQMVDVPKDVPSYPDIHILSHPLQKIKAKKTLENILPYGFPALNSFFTYCYDLTPTKTPHYEGLKQLFDTFAH